MLWVSAVWGACFVMIRWGLRDAPVLWFAALRALVAGVALLGVASVHGRPKPTGGRVWVLIGLMAVTNTSIGFAAMFGGVNGLATGTAAVLTNAQPLLVLLHGVVPLRRGGDCPDAGWAGRRLRPGADGRATRPMDGGWAPARSCVAMDRGSCTGCDRMTCDAR